MPPPPLMYGTPPRPASSSRERLDPNDTIESVDDAADSDRRSVSSLSSVSSSVLGGAKYMRMDASSGNIAGILNKAFEEKGTVIEGTIITIENEDDDDDETDIEPRLKYERLSAELKSRILSNDKATALAVNSKFLVLGTHWGQRHMLDALGNPLPDSVLKKHSHSLSVSQISIDHAGEFVGSCSGVDGRVIITGLYTLENNHNFQPFNDGRPIYSISLDPLYSKNHSGRRFMTGDERVYLHEKTSLINFNRYKQIALSGPGDGPITRIKWRGRFAAWCGRRGVVVYDIITMEQISIIKYEVHLPTSQEIAVDKRTEGEYVTRLAWSDQYTLYMSQGDNVKICKIKKRSDPIEILRQRDLPGHLVEIVSAFKLEDSWVCGIAPMDDRLIVILAMPKDDPTRVEMLVVEALEDDFNYISTDVLAIDGEETTVMEDVGSANDRKLNSPHDYDLECLLADKQYYVISPNELVMGKPCDMDDHIDWLLDHEKFEDALASAEQNPRILRRHSIIDIGKGYLNFLLNDLQFVEASKLCIRVFKNDKKLWQDIAVSKFGRIHQLKVLAPYLPIGSSNNQVQLDKHVYENVLLFLLRDGSDEISSQEMLLDLIRQKWPPELYDDSLLVNAVMEVLLQDAENAVLQRVLATLFTHQHKYDRAMAMYLKLGHKDVFGLIRKHNLFSAIHDKIGELMDLDQREGLKLFLEHMDRLPTELIIQRLKEKPGSGKHLFLYLDALMEKDKEGSRKYHGNMVSLYADYAPERLLSFLKSSDHYNLQEALSVCELRVGLTEERVFILARMGHTKEALELITREMADIHRAIEFCKEYDDPALWDNLIDYSIDKPYFINVLLHHIGTHVDPRILIQKIQHGQEIPGLRDSLVRILQDYHLQISLQEGCKKILVFDTFSLITRQERIQSRGTCIDKDAQCGGCGAPIIQPNLQKGLSQMPHPVSTIKGKGAGKNSSSLVGGPTAAAIEPMPGIMTGSIGTDIVGKGIDVVSFMCKHVFHVECLSDEEGNVCNLCEGKRKITTRL